MYTFENTNALEQIFICVLVGVLCFGLIRSISKTSLNPPQEIVDTGEGVRSSEGKNLGLTRDKGQANPPFIFPCSLGVPQVSHEKVLDRLKGCTWGWPGRPGTR